MKSECCQTRINLKQHCQILICNVTVSVAIRIQSTLHSQIFQSGERFCKQHSIGKLYSIVAVRIAAQ